MTQFYVGVKIVEAWPQEKDGEPGFAIKYEDGYISWSPAKAFEAYTPVGTDRGKAESILEAVKEMIREAVEPPRTDMMRRDMNQ